MTPTDLDSGRLRFPPDDSKRLRTIQTPGGTSGKDFDGVGIDLTVAGIGSDSFVRYKEHITTTMSQVPMVTKIF